MSRPPRLSSKRSAIFTGRILPVQPDLFLAFLQPKFDPSIEQDLAEQDVEEGAPGLPTSNSPKLKNGRAGSEEEFRPFIRRLPEFQFWYSATKAIVIALFATLFP